MIVYQETLERITPDQLQGFFQGWPNPPSPEAHLRLLRGSEHLVLALDSETNNVIGFVTAISDGVLSAYIPLLEVLPDYQQHGIGTELMQRVLARLSSMYMIDLVCDPDLQAYYERFGMQPASAMIIRKRQFQGES